MEPNRRSARSAAARTLLGVLALGVVALLAGSSVTAGADLTAARERRAALRAQQAQVASQVNALEGSEDSVTAALAALDENVRGQQAVMVEARRQAESSYREAERAEADAAETGRQLDRLRARMTDYAVAAYVSPPDEQLFREFEAASAQQDASRRAFLDLRSGNDLDLIDQLRATKRRLEEQLTHAREARATAEAQLAAAEAALGSLTAAQAEQQRFADQVRARLDERLSEAQYLSRLDASFAAQIAAEASKLADAVSNVPVSPPSAGGSGSGTGGGSGSGTGTGTGTTGGSSGGTTNPPVTAPPITPTPGLVTVGGITVAASIGEQLRQLLSAASSAGINLGGYGYRDINAQIQLRRQNCGTSDYAIWYMPADGCRPPTARPGYSMHERGLAIDFQANGSFINSRTNPGFVWLAANAGRFGFINLPSEPWHWSVSGS
jgi:peptidoglycan hydrolase CwlO-like protein